MGMKRIYLDAGFRPNPLYRELVSCPPEGYEFITSSSSWQKKVGGMARKRLPFVFLSQLDSAVPFNLVRAWLQGFRHIPRDVDLIYSCGLLVFTRKPWIVDQEYVNLLIGSNLNLFRRFKGVIEKAFASDYCKKVICWSEVAKKVILSNLNCERFQDKLETVYFAIRKKDFIKSYNGDRIKLLFVGSANLPGEFEIKGGREAMEAFILLKKRYSNIDLVIRSDIPPDIKRQYAGMENVRMIENVLPREMLEHEYKSADIFILPAHNTPWMVPLEAMSYELPVVTIDAWGNPEIVEDGKTGLLVKKSEKLRYYTDNFLPYFGTRDFAQAIKAPDPKVIAELAEKTGILIENAELRRKMGQAGRQEVEKGKFSIETRNEKLRNIFDEATGGKNKEG